MMRKTAVGVLLVLFLTVAATAAMGQDYAALRQAMVEDQIVARGVVDEAVLEAMRTTPRHAFVPKAMREYAYMDRPLPIGHGQTISQPYMVAYMTEALKLTGREKVLEIGTGSGYQAAILAGTAGEVFSMEIIGALHRSAAKRLAGSEYDNVQLKWGDGYYGWPEEAPFDGIVVTCAADHIPPPLIRQLAPGGRMLIPVGPPGALQTLVLGVRTESGFERKGLFPVVFVPLVREEK